MDLSPKTIQVKLLDKMYPIRRASVMEVRLASKKMKAAGEDVDKILELQAGIIEKCGMPKEVIETLDMEQFTDLSECVMGSKKN